MRIYTLQIHATADAEKLDDLFHYFDFNNLCAEFKDKVSELKKIAEPIDEAYPQMDGNGEVRGGFRFANADGTCIVGVVYDYDILDDD